MAKVFVFISLLFSLASKGQTITLKFHKVFPTEKETLNYIRFEINGQTFGEKDSIIQLKINKHGFDKCTAIIAHDTLNFLTKFIKNELYEIEQGCCCAAFILKAHKNPSRGTITYKNKTKKNLGLVIADANKDTIKTRKRETTFASESAMCYFKPCSILITEIEYLSPKYDYNSDNKDYEKLWKEQEKLILASTWFHFLHGEKIEVFYNIKNHQLKVKLKGYLKKHEYKNN